jgi:HK97 family phage major capsid protein
MSELNAIVSKIEELGQRIDKDYATKSDLANFASALKAYNVEREKDMLKTKKNRIFGDELVAKEFCGYLENVVASHPKLKARDPMNLGREQKLVTKAALDATTAGNGANTIPTAVSDQLHILITEFGKARQLHDVIYMAGNIDLPIATDDATAAYSTNDITDGSDTKQTLSKVTLSPKQMLAIYRASGKLLYNSAINVAEMVASALVRAAGRLEDDTCWIADGTSTYGSMTGYSLHASVPEIAVGGISAVTLDNLINLKYEASETVDGDGVFYIARALKPKLKQLKASTAGSYHLQLEGTNIEIDGSPVVIVNRFSDGSTADDMVCLYGDLRKAGKIGVNRDLAVDLDTSVDFIRAGLVWRLVEDFAFAVPNPTAVARLVVNTGS